jgi:hypothetical protein
MRRPVDCLLDNSVRVLKESAPSVIRIGENLIRKCKIFIGMNHLYFMVSILGTVLVKQRTERTEGVWTCVLLVLTKNSRIKIKFSAHKI